MLYGLASQKPAACLGEQLHGGKLSENGGLVERMWLLQATQCALPRYLRDPVFNESILDFSLSYYGSECHHI